MSENNCSSAILATKHFGFKSGQMQAVVAKDSDWLIRKLQGTQTDADFFKEWTMGSATDAIVPGSVNKVGVNLGNDIAFGRNLFFGSKVMSLDQAKILMSAKRIPTDMIVTYDQLPQSLKKLISPRFVILLQKTPSGFEHKCRRGFTALRFNGLLKQKCKKGKRRKYPLIVKSNFNL